MRPKSKPKSSGTLSCNRRLDALRALFNHRCANPNCKMSEYDNVPRHLLDFAHVKPTPIAGHNARGKWQRLRDILTHPDCYTLLCNTCHNYLDHYDPKALKTLPTVQDMMDVHARLQKPIPQT